MNAILLAAGLGTRLRPYTLCTPKCLIDVGGKPLLRWWLDWLHATSAIDSVLINTHHLAEQVVEYVKEVRHLYPFRIDTRYEARLLGTGASVHRYVLEPDVEWPVVVCLADTLVHVEWHAFLGAHRLLNAHYGTLLLFHTEEPRECGVVTLDGEGYIDSIVEKPSYPQGNLAVAGLMILRRPISALAPTADDLVGGILTQCATVPRGLAGVVLPGHVLDVGTPQRLALARQSVADKW